MINSGDLYSVVQILDLRAKSLEFHFQQIERGYCGETREFVALNHELRMLYKSITMYDFISKIKEGNTLLVGEGNLSFTMSLVKKLQFLPHLTTSIYEDSVELSEHAQFNATFLKKAGIEVLYGLDATELHKNFHSNAFDAIIFQFPHSGSREGINEVNATYILIKNFIVSASQILKPGGIILTTIVDSDFYNHMFRFDELAEELGIGPPIKYAFDPKDYPEYEHTMTHQEESGIDHYSKFATYEFHI